jgi:cytochrome c oxidase subunit 2
MKKLLYGLAKSANLRAMSLLMLSLTALAAGAYAQASGDVIEPPKEFSLSTSDLVTYAYWVLAALVLGVIIYIFDIGSLSEKLTGRKVISWDNVNGWVAIIFMVAGLAGVTYEMIYHGERLLPESASEHGSSIDSMFNWTFGFTFVVFIITEVLLFWFMFRYRYRKGGKAAYYYHNNQLEIAWTIVPAIVLTFLVLRGYSTWDKITQNPDPKAQQIEVFGYQFGWKARYAGTDNKFGESNYNFIDPSGNELGLALKPNVVALRDTLSADTGRLGNQLRNLSAMQQEVAGKLAKLDRDIDGKAYTDTENELEDIRNGNMAAKLRKEMKRKGVQIQRINNMLANETIFNGTANDDKVTTEIHLVKGKAYNFRFRARDVIHSAYMPYFRAQMNVVPGMMTQFTLTPTKTTEEIRSELNNKEFDYYLFCAKICGGAHYNMKIKIVVESEAAYNAWMNKQKQVVEPAAPANPAAPAEKTDSTVAKNMTMKSQTLAYNGR